MQRRASWALIMLLVLTLTAVAAAPGARAGDFPSQPLRLIIGFPPGSAADITARLVGAHMSETLGQQLVIESRTAPAAASPRSSSRARRRTATPCTSARRRT
jgi:tripartite-type tricarboxylate transporter receptor subunit TctC